MLAWREESSQTQDTPLLGPKGSLHGQVLAGDAAEEGAHPGSDRV